MISLFRQREKKSCVFIFINLCLIIIFFFLIWLRHMLFYVPLWLLVLTIFSSWVHCQCDRFSLCLHAFLFMKIINLPYGLFCTHSVRWLSKPFFFSFYCCCEKKMGKIDAIASEQHLIGSIIFARVICLCVCVFLTLIWRKKHNKSFSIEWISWNLTEFKKWNRRMSLLRSIYCVIGTGRYFRFFLLHNIYYYN